ncbi:hypothetical protein J4207_06425 [Candidatus Woesearchaeota archaeon]|nr:hypothetical protein [Candidatus Woesearchaeota archaeon]
MISGDGLYREYNSLNQLVNVRNGSDSSGPLLQQFVYHPIEERIDIKKTFNNSGTVVETVYYWSKTFVTVENLTGQFNFTYVYHEGQLIAQEVQGTRLFIHGNHEGSSSVVTNAAGSVIERTEYTPYGEILTGGTVSRFDYEGKEFDSAVDDIDFHFRKMKPEWGLFLQPDTLIQNVYDPQSLNRYMFEKGNPYKYKDKDGHSLTAASEIVLFESNLLIVQSYSELILFNDERLNPKLEKELKEARKDAFYDVFLGLAAVHPAAIPVELKLTYDNYNQLQRNVQIIQGANPERMQTMCGSPISSCYQKPSIVDQTKVDQSISNFAGSGGSKNNNKVILTGDKSAKEEIKNVQKNLDAGAYGKNSAAIKNILKNAKKSRR